MKWLKRVLIGTGVTLALLVALAFVVPLLVPTSTYKEQIQSRVKAATGRDLSLQGDVRLTILPALSLTAKYVSFANRPGAPDKDMVNLKELDLRLRLAPLLAGRIEVDELVLHRPEIVLEIDKDGRANWQFDRPGEPAAKTPPPRPDAKSGPTPSEAKSRFDALRSTQITELRIVDGRIRYSDARSGERHEISKANLTLALPGGNRPIRVGGDVETNGQTLRFKTELGTPDDALDGKPADFVVEASTVLATVNVAGKVQLGVLPKLSSKVRLDIASVRDLASWLGVRLEKAPLLGKLALTADVDGSSENLSVAALTLKLDGLTATGGFTMALGAAPLVRANLHIASDYGRLSFNGTGAGGAKPAVTGRLVLDVPSVRKTAQAFGAALPPGNTFGSLALSGTLAVSPAGIAVSGLALKMDKVETTGDLAVALGGVPMVRGNLVIPQLDLNPYLAAAAPGERDTAVSPGATPGMRPATPPAGAPAMAANPLRAVNADLTLNARAVRYQTHTVDEALIGIKLQDGALRLNLTRVAAYRGVATGTVTATFARGLSLAPSVKITGVDLKALLAALGGTDRLLGTFNADVNVTAAGNTAQALMSTLSGQAAFRVTNGAIRGYNLAGMVRAVTDIRNPLEIVQSLKRASEALNNPDPNQRTDFSELAATYSGANGSFATSDLRMAAPLLRLEGTGTVALAGQQVNKRILLRAVPTLQGQGSEFAKLGIPIPLRVAGSFGNLRYGLDEAALGEEVRKKGPEILKDAIKTNPADLLKKPGSLLEQFRR
jgi:AsmA protein